jgi:hypothetical protein
LSDLDYWVDGCYRVIQFCVENNHLRFVFYFPPILNWNYILLFVYVHISLYLVQYCCWPVQATQGSFQKWWNNDRSSFRWSKFPAALMCIIMIHYYRNLCVWLIFLFVWVWNSFTLLFVMKHDILSNDILANYSLPLFIVISWCMFSLAKIFI